MELSDDEKFLAGAGGRNRVKFHFEVSVPEKMFFFTFLRLWGSKLIIIFDKNTNIDECVV